MCTVLINCDVLNGSLRIVVVCLYRSEFNWISFQMVSSDCKRKSEQLAHVLGAQPPAKRGTLPFRKMSKEEHDEKQEFERARHA